MDRSNEIKEMLAILGATRSELADIIGVAHGMIGRWERGTLVGKSRLAAFDAVYSAIKLADDRGAFRRNSVAELRDGVNANKEARIAFFERIINENLGDI